MFNSFVISNNTIEPEAPKTGAVILEDIIPKLPAQVITIEQALEALEK